MQQFFDKIKGKEKPVFLAVFVLIIAIIAVIIFSSTEKEETVTYDYNAAQQKLADDVKAYLALYIDIPDDVAAQLADEAVSNYNFIISSGVDIVNDDHTDAIKQRIRRAMITLIQDAASMSDDDLDGMSSGIAEIIWNMVLSRIEEVTTDSSYEQDYIYLTESIQKQIDELEERKMKVSIQANIKNNQDAAELDAESLLAAVNGMTDEELEELARSLGLSLEELKELLDSYGKNIRDGIENELAKEFEKKLTELKKEITNEMQAKYANSVGSSSGSSGRNGTNGTNGKDGNNGRDGRNGEDGKDGQDGKDGADGSDGADGKTTYIAYADDIGGAGFSLTPTETSKYVGTCITAESSQPTDYASYSNWQIYRTYIITTTVDENNVTTVHIN